eukprot:2463186-Alexandrium_andersonii.AAC.1
MPPKGVDAFRRGFARKRLRVPKHSKRYFFAFNPLLPERRWVRCPVSLIKGRQTVHDCTYARSPLSPVAVEYRAGCSAA